MIGSESRSRRWRRRVKPERDRRNFCAGTGQARKLSLRRTAEGLRLL